MHPQRSAQNVLLCDSCETVPLQSHCELCNINLCTTCVSKHLSDSSKRHNVVPYLHRKSATNHPKCPTHVDKHCELFCEKCGIPVCSTCVSSGEHKGHDISEVLIKFESITQSLQKDLEELETRIYPRYEEIASDVQTEKAELKTSYGKLTTAADQRGEVWHLEVTAIVKKRKSDIEEMKSKHLAVLEKQSNEITQRITELKQIIQDLRKILNSNDVSLASTYASRNSEFRQLPPKVKVKLPSFSPSTIDTEQLYQMFGSFSSLTITKEQEYTMKSPEAVSRPPVKLLIGEPRLTATIDTGYRDLFSASCLSDEQVWTCGDDKMMELLNLQGKLLTSIQTESGKIPDDIAVTRDGDLVYTDYINKTVNLVKNKQIQAVITLQGWRPLNVCCTSSDELLVTMISDDYNQSKVVRYSGSTETQTIQLDGQGCPLYSSDSYSKYISENRNLDICVADNKAKAVVVVNQSGKFRFRYTGHSSNTKKLFYALGITSKESFDPRGITTDSQSHILTADYRNHRIHILNQDGRFLRYIQNCDLRCPWGLCVDIRDNLFVAENTMLSPKVKKIQYL
ncbi:tripartite motif-containing protein 2-like [Ostrea edulis]|uniref:tripartite motif-containing protein 2-like n=1 Tax=Ostrea edulis TaxID=37623 RepID=UPI0024AEA9AF|nr:tripartite motif-containing protein 2-like [Ostrea edulis]